jgi:MFS family permease
MAIAGVVTLILIPASRRVRHGALRGENRGTTDYGSIVHNSAFKFIVLGMGLCSLSITVQSSQLKFIMESMGVDSARASIMISLYATGVIVGRLTCGAALDRFPSYIVASMSLGLPGIGLFLLALGITTPVLIATSMILLGLSLGTELDIAGYLIMSYFELEVYSAVLGIVIGVIALSGAFGSLILSVSLRADRGYAPFLLSAAACALLGSWLLWMLRACRQRVVLFPEPV